MGDSRREASATKQMGVLQRPDKSSIYAVAVTAVAAALLVHYLPETLSLINQNPRGIGMLFVLLMVAGIVTYVALRGGGAVTGTAVVNFAVIITYGGPVAAWLAAIEMLILTRILLRFSTLRSLFNVSQMAVSLILAGVVYQAAGGTRLGLSDWAVRMSPGSLVPLALCHLTYFFANTVLVTVWSSLRGGRSVLRTWKASYLWMMPRSFAAPVVGVLLAYVLVRLSAWLVVVFFLWLIYYARTSKTNLELQDSQRGTVAALATTVDSSTPFLEGESERVAGLAVELGRRIGLSGWRMQALEYAALLHDIGYLAVGKGVLAKVECLSPDEWAVVRNHAEVGASIIGSVRSLRRVSEIVRSHHERPDGKGYPRGLAGEKIPREARVLKVADAFVAMTSNRPYRSALSIGDAIRKIRSGAGSNFDIQTVRGLLDLQSAAALDQYGTPLTKAA